MEEQILKLLEEKFQEEGFEALFFVEMSFNETNKKLEIFLDSDTTLNIRQCARINRYLQKHIDEAGWLGEKYILDVSSHGVGKPLKMKRQYFKNIGRNIEVKLEDNSTKEGKLLEANEERIILEEQVPIAPKKKKKIAQQTEIPFTQIKKTKVKISFK